MSEICKGCGESFGTCVLDECEECGKKICPDCDHCGCMGGEIDSDNEYNDLDFEMKDIDEDDEEDYL